MLNWISSLYCMGLCTCLCMCLRTCLCMCLCTCLCMCLCMCCACVCARVCAWHPYMYFRGLFVDESEPAEFDYYSGRDLCIFKTGSYALKDWIYDIYSIYIRYIRSSQSTALWTPDGFRSTNFSKRPFLQVWDRLKEDSIWYLNVEKLFCSAVEVM